ncbi:hypothetical protein [Xylanimonas ulmi]|uniref:Cell division protein FtsL n=1 Tax=Xylanimonas ulmi TaxID=228973 RepID=A0A4Q7M370_9MICO|nr:hypothetical protein [Xylanibacterium ulmi]RZS61297.1 hypothetical protein EV386_1594 [Xylanibacterium ulmi]
MSALRAPATVPSRPAAPSRGTRLTALPGGRVESRRRFAAVRAPLQARSGVPFLALCGAVLAAALLAVLVLNTTMARGSYEMAGLQGQLVRTSQDVQTKQESLRTAERTLKDRATGLGMVPSDSASFLDITGSAGSAAPTAEAGR